MDSLSEFEALEDPLEKLKFGLNYIKEKDFLLSFLSLCDDEKDAEMYYDIHEKYNLDEIEILLLNFDCIDMNNTVMNKKVIDANSCFSEHFKIRSGQSKLKLNEIRTELRRLHSISLDLSSLFPKPFKFKCERIVYGRDVIEASLKQYINTAKLIRESDDFENSPMDTLEKVILNPLGTIKSVLSESSLPNEVKSENLKKSFVALVSPSLSGKTQSAFVMKNVRPLYFPFNPLNSRNRKREISNIGKNFISLTECLKECAKEDKVKFKSAKSYTEYHREEKFAELPSGSKLVSQFPDEKSCILGFLMALIERSEREFNPNEKCWMQYHADRRDFYFIQKTAIEFIEFMKDKNNYCVFLDVFPDIEWTVLLRDICCDVGIRCIVSSANADIINLANLSEICGIRGKTDTFKFEVWSIVFRLMNYRKCTLELSDMPQYREIQTDQLGHFEMFFDYLKTVKMLPGVLQILNEEVKKVPMTGTFLEFFNESIDKVGSGIKLRAVNIVQEVNDVFSNLRLFYKHAYSSEDCDTGAYNPKSCLKNHLYYLENPTKKSEFLFLTYPNEFFTNFTNEINVLKADPTKGKVLASWLLDNTYFNKDDLITALACLAIKTGWSIANVSFETYRASLSFPGLSDISTEGERLETKSKLSIIDSSNRNRNTGAIAFEGQNGIAFVKNIVKNLSYYRDPETTFQNSADYNIESFLGSLTVPFLFLNDIHPLLESFNSNGVVNLGTCKTTPYFDPVDVLFEISEDSKPRLAVAESKFWLYPVSFRKINGMIIDAIKRYNPRIFLLFLKRVSKRSTETHTKTLIETCTTNQVNIFRISCVKERKFEMVPLFTPLKEAKMNVIIFEIKEIDHNDPY